MKCRLCDRPTAAGAGKLCADCAKALQRARGAALRNLEPATTIAGVARTAAPITLTVARPATAPALAARPMLWVAIGLAAIVALYVAQRELSAPGEAEPPVSGRMPTLTEHGNVEPSPVITRVEEPSWTAVAEAARPAAGSDLGQATAIGGVPRAPVASAGAKMGARLAKGGSHDPKAVPLPSAEYGGDAPKPPQAESETPLAGGAVAMPAAPVDGAQVLASAMQKCGTEGFLAKFICEQKAFLQYCEDKWDKDPRCMRKVGER